MLDALKFCQGSVATKDFVPELKHFAIANGRVRGFNGILALSSPIPFDIDCKPKAQALVKAIANCTETVLLTMTPAGRLSIKSAGFKVNIDCLTEDTLHVEPEGELIQINGSELMKGLRAVVPFIGDDASRPWSNGVLLKDQSMFATNNAVIVEYFHGTVFPHVVNLPRDAVREMLRINQVPVSAQLTDNSITFHYENSRWLRTQLYINQWPDLEKVLNHSANLTPINEELFIALETVKPFIDKIGSIFFKNGQVCTHDYEDEGATHDVVGLGDDGYYKLANLMLLKGTAKVIDWSGSGFKGACIFQGDRLRGAIIGLKRVTL
jgi:DNA polymerase III sliding clamp (beta) subunit (PCNA family)